MASTFGGLEIARTGLAISQRQLDITGHNIANIDTEGYSRQRLETAAIDPLSGATRFYYAGTGRVGGGVEALSTRQIRDLFLDRQYRDQASVANQWATRYEAMEYISRFFNETENSATGFATTISKFFDAISNVGNNYVENLGVRTAVVGAASSLNVYFSAKYDQMYNEMISQNKAVISNVNEINAIAQKIAILNDKILSYEFDGKEYANDLRDKRNLELDKLAELVDIEYGEEIIGNDPTNIHFWISLGSDPSHRLVDHTIASQIVVEETGLDQLTGMEFDNLAKQIASYNTALMDPANTGDPEKLAQLLHDRAKLVDQLAHYAESLGGELVVDYDGTLVALNDIVDDLSDINPLIDYGNLNLSLVGSMGNIDIVVADTASVPPSSHNVSLAASGADFTTLPGAFTMAKLSWDDGAEVSITNGELYGHLVMRDGSDRESNGLPYYIFQLNEYVRTLANEFNAIHEKGWTMPYLIDGVIQQVSMTGLSFFVSKDGGPITAGSIALNDLIGGPDGSPCNLALSSYEILVGAPSDQSGNNEIGMELYRMLDKNIMKDGLVFDSAWSKLIADIAVGANYAKTQDDVNTRVQMELDNKRLSIMGVSMEEEMVNMVRFNHAYGAASRVITAMDEVLDKLINGTGIVGR